MSNGRENLRTPSTEEAREIGRKGGIASGEARRAKRTFRELLEVALETEVKNPKTGEVKTLKDVGMLNVAKQVKDGNLKAVKLAAELLGEYRQSLDIGGEGVKIVVQDAETADKLQGILERAKERGTQDKENRE